MNNEPRIQVSIVVPTCRRPEMLERCLAALVTQDFDRHRFEVIVADDGDEPRVRSLVDRWAQLLEGAPAVLYVPVRATQGPAGARNAGWRHAAGDLIAFTDDDTIPRPNWLREGWAAMAEPDVVAAAGAVRVPPTRAEPPEAEPDVERGKGPELSTANCFVTRQALRAIGGFDDRFTAAWREDADLEFRLLGARGRIALAPRAVVEQPVSAEGWRQRLRAYRKFLFDALLYKKHPRLYRERIRRSPPWRYYAIVLSLLVLLAGLLARSLPAVAAGAAVWLGLTASFVGSRIRNMARAPSSRMEMLLTSIAIPPLAVFWRLAGAWRFRVPFL